MTQNIERVASLSLLVITLTACNILGPVKTPPIKGYDLREVPNVPPTGVRVPVTLLVNIPDAAQTFNTMQMAYSLRPFQVSYYGLSQWTATPPQMLQPLLLQTLQNHHRYRAVTIAPSIALYDYVLDTKILDFIIDWTQCPPAARLLISAQVVRARGNKVVGTKRVEVVVPMLGRTPYAGASAMNHAAAKAVSEITHFVDNVVR